MFGIMLIVSIMALLGGFAAGLGCTSQYIKKSAIGATRSRQVGAISWGILTAVGGLVGILWCFLSPPPFSMRVSGPPAHHRNDPAASVYFGNGCFWHTQYDFVVLEQDLDGPFGGRSDAEVTSMVGYAGGHYESFDGNVCYHGLPTSDYNRLGHSEAVSITIDVANVSAAKEQIVAVAKLYFGDHGFSSLEDGRRQRLDPQDAGPEYRNVIGLPGGMDNADWWPLIEAANKYKMPLIRGAGGPGSDREDDHVIYVYDTVPYPFFRGEPDHQFHKNDVLGRSVPRSYTGDLKQTQKQHGRLDELPNCPGVPAELMLLLSFIMGGIFGIGCSIVWNFLPQNSCSCSKESRPEPVTGFDDAAAP